MNREGVVLTPYPANLNFAVGDTFVWEVQGNDTGAGGLGSYVAPPGTPLYPEFLFLNGPGCVDDCGWRLAFQSYMVGGGGAVTPVCFGDGAACGCGNETGGTGGGCANGLGVGALLNATGTADTTADTVQATVSNVTAQPGLYFQGNNNIGGGNGVTFGDGIRCCGGGVIRLEILFGMQPEPTTVNTSVTISAHPGQDTTTMPGTTFCYQYWYRDPQGSPCGANFNLSNALNITWV